jgi:hypothetical protein
MAAVVADDALWLAGGAGGFRVGHRLGPRDVAAGLELAGGLGALQDDARGGGVLGEIERVVDHRLVVDDAGGLDAARRRDHHRRPGVVDARGEFVCGESAEHHGVHGAESGRGQHRDDGLGHHRHVDDDAVALLDAESAQHAREARGLVEQLAIGVGALGAGER